MEDWENTAGLQQPQGEGSQPGESSENPAPEQTLRNQRSLTQEVAERLATNWPYSAGVRDYVARHGARQSFVSRAISDVSSHQGQSIAIAKLGFSSLLGGSLAGLSGDPAVKKLAGALLSHNATFATLRQDVLRFANSPHVSEIGRSLESLRSSVFDPQSPLSSAIAGMLKAQDSFQSLFRSPGAEEIRRMAEGISVNRGVVASTIEPAKLATAMSAMHSPWLSAENPLGSAAAFAELQHIGELATTASFLKASKAIRPSLGDFRKPLRASLEALADADTRGDLYRERGFNFELTAFPAPAFQEGLTVAGLLVAEDFVPNEDRGDLNILQLAAGRIQRFEAEIRKLISSKMIESFGPDWVRHRIPHEMLENWIFARNKDPLAGREERSIIEYADFTDYCKILLRRDNWQQIFQPIFGHRTLVEESFRRLYPLRIASMHSRRLTPEDLLILATETMVLMKAVRSGG